MNIAAYPKYESYKPTCVTWSPEVPAHWDIKPVAAAARVISEANQPALELLSVYLGRGVVRFSDVEEKRTNATSLDLSKYQVVRPGNLVLNNQQAWRGSVGVSKHTGIVSPAYIVLDLGGAFDHRFADYYFQTSTTVSHFLVSSKGVGTIQRNLYWPALRRCPITIPPLPEQRAIAAFLDNKCTKIDEAVRIKEEQITLLRERRQILIQQAVTRGLNPDAPMKDSGIDWIGEIPAHWEVKRIKDVSRTVRTGRTPPSSAGMDYFAEGIIPWYTPGDVVEAGEFISSEKSVSQAAVGHGYVDIYPPNSIYFIGIGGTLGKANLSRVAASCNQQFNVIEPTKKCSPEWILAWLNSSRELIFNQTDYTTLPIMNQAKTKRIPIPVPPLSEQINILSEILRLQAKISSAISIKQDQIATLKEYKASLINAAVTGKIKVI